MTQYRIEDPRSRPRRSCWAIRVAVALGVVAAGGPGVEAATPAAVVVLPYVVSGGDGREDTWISLANTAAEPISVLCFFEGSTPRCDGVTTPWCDPFRISLAADQPLGWRVSSGRSDDIGGFVPSVPDPFAGALRCYVEGEDGAARPNALIATATAEFAAEGGDRGDAASYAAYGFRATGLNRRSDAVVEHGTESEHEACPAVVASPITFAGAVFEGAGSDFGVETTLAVASCGQHLPEDLGMREIVVVNEFAQRFTTATSREGVAQARIETIDQPGFGSEFRSIFGAGVQGTATGSIQVRERGVEPRGLTGVVVEVDVAADFGNRLGTAIRPMAVLARSGHPDLSVLRPPRCVGDCNGDGVVSVDELIAGVTTALEANDVVGCSSFDPDGSERITVDELLTGVTNALGDCRTRNAMPVALGPAVVEPPPLPSVTDSRPEIVAFAVVGADGSPRSPAAGGAGREIFTVPSGHGFMLVVEARAGTDGNGVGSELPTTLAALRSDLQVIVSRDLGDGPMTACDASRPDLGGVAATVPFAFGEDGPTRAMLAVGCRAFATEARKGPCTVETKTGMARFLTSTTGVRQFCIPIARPDAFPPGETSVAVRVANSAGDFGRAREIVVRVE